MLKFIDDIAGSLYDIMKFLVRSLCYFLTGVLIVAIPLMRLFLCFKRLVSKNIHKEKLEYERGSIIIEKTDTN